MKLSKEQSKLLNRALYPLSQDHSRIVRRLFIEIMKSDAWFSKLIMRIMSNDITIIAQHVETLGRYYMDSKILVINLTVLNNLDKISGLKQMLKIVLRHELIHAFDAIGMTRTIYGETILSKSALKNLMTSLNVANILSKQLGCITQMNKLNFDVLKKISDFKLVIEEDPRYIYLGASNNTPDLYMLFQEMINMFGSAPIASGSSIETLSFMIRQELLFENNFYLIESTHDLSIAFELFNNTVGNREAILEVSNKTLAEQDFLSNFIDNKNLLFWRSLDKQQSQTIDLFYSIQTQLMNGVAKDELCYPALSSCVTMSYRNCFQDFYQCQLETNKEYATISLLEMRAILHERSYSNRLDTNLLSSLCNSSDNPQLGVNQLLSLQMIQQFSLHFGYGIGYGFFNEITQNFLERYKINYKNFLKLVSSMSFVLSSGYINYLMTDDENASLTTQIIFPLSILLLSKSFEEILSRYVSSRTGQVMNAIVSTLFVGAQLATTSLSQLASNITASSIGNWVGKRIGTFFQPPPLKGATNMEDNYENQNSSLNVFDKYSS